MIVDNSSSVRLLLKSTLIHAGYDVITGVDGVDALAKLKTSPVDLVVTDLDMPNIDGFELVEKLRNLPIFKFIPIIMLSTFSQRQLKTKGKQIGITCWITKPFSPLTLVKLVKRSLK